MRYATIVWGIGISWGIAVASILWGADNIRPITQAEVPRWLHLGLLIDRRLNAVTDAHFKDEEERKRLMLSDVRLRTVGFENPTSVPNPWAYSIGCSMVGGQASVFWTVNIHMQAPGHWMSISAMYNGQECMPLWGIWYIQAAQKNFSDADKYAWDKYALPAVKRPPSAIKRPPLIDITTLMHNQPSPREGMKIISFFKWAWEEGRIIPPLAYQDTIDREALDYNNKQGLGNVWWSVGVIPMSHFAYYFYIGNFEKNFKTTYYHRFLIMKHSALKGYLDRPLSSTTGGQRNMRPTLKSRHIHSSFTHALDLDVEHGLGKNQHHIVAISTNGLFGVLGRLNEIVPDAVFPDLPKPQKLVLRVIPFHQGSAGKRTTTALTEQDVWQLPADVTLNGLVISNTGDVAWIVDTDSEEKRSVDVLRIGLWKRPALLSKAESKIAYYEMAHEREGRYKSIQPFPVFGYNDEVGVISCCENARRFTPCEELLYRSYPIPLLALTHAPTTDRPKQPTDTPFAYIPDYSAWEANRAWGQRGRLDPDPPSPRPHSAQAAQPIRERNRFASHLLEPGELMYRRWDRKGKPEEQPPQPALVSRTIPKWTTARLIQSAWTRLKQGQPITQEALEKPAQDSCTAGEISTKMPSLLKHPILPLPFDESYRMM